MQHTSRIFAVAVAIALTATASSAQTRPFEVPRARSAQAAGAALSLPSTASARAIVAQYLRGRGHDQATVDALVEARRNAGRQGIAHVQFELRAAGLPVYGVYAKAAINARGELVSLIDNVVAVPRTVRRAEIAAQRAIDAAVSNLYPALRTIPPGFFRSAPSAARVAIPHADGSMSAGFLVETWAQQSNQLHETLVDGDGAILNVESRTSSDQDQYNVFRINPTVTPQQVVSGPGAGNAESPAGWLAAGAQGSTHISGNNVSAYLDARSNNRSDAPGTPVSDGHFLASADLGVSPSTQGNRNVAVQNLFYLNNVIHDELYRHGFTEAAQNFQESNFAQGGSGSDSVNAEAQDGGGTDNANFATPRDGRNPRMQMFLWTGKGTHRVDAGGLTYLAQGAEFGPALTPTGVSSTIRLVNDGTGTVTDGCEALPAGSMSGAIALIDRGSCDFTVKVKNAQLAGAVAAIVANNRDGDSIIVMGGTDASISIPAVFISQNSGAAIRTGLPTSGTVRLAPEPPLQIDSDLDADIVFHEYCHGLTWRMIGGMSGPLAGAIGEGMGDLCAMLMTLGSPGADAIGEYAFSDPVGIRRQRYANYNLIDYGDIVGEEVHNDGEVYAAIGWKMIDAFTAARKDDLFGYLVDGMNYTPATPTFEQMRDGILQSIANTPTATAGDDCRVWRAFAHYGVGVGAQAVVGRRSVTVTPSFTVPTACQP